VEICTFLNKQKSAVVLVMRVTILFVLTSVFLCVVRGKNAGQIITLFHGRLALFPPWLPPLDFNFAKLDGFNGENH